MKIGEKEQAILFGVQGGFLKMIEEGLNVNISAVAEDVVISSNSSISLKSCAVLLKELLEVLNERSISKSDITSAISMVQEDYSKKKERRISSVLKNSIKVAGIIKSVSAKNETQQLYMKAIDSYDLSFGIGPAGTGKTFIAMALAINYLISKKVNKIILTRPAVEAGEKLGFLPGDIAEKLDPYLRPLYDALFSMLDREYATKLIEKGIIELAPLAFMRGRTFNDAFVILDEAQNTTKQQMKMFLTRLGFNSKVVITGDITQIDLPENELSGLVHAINILKPIKDISFTIFKEADIIRHPLVAKILKAYDK